MTTLDPARLARALALDVELVGDPRAIDYGGYMIVDTATNIIAAGGNLNGFSLTLDDVEEWLTTEEE